MPSQAYSDSAVRDAASGWTFRRAAGNPVRIAASPALPPWLPEAPWRAFADMRRAVRGVPFPPEAQRALIARLERLVRSGHCPTRLLAKATAGRWRTVFAAADTINPRPEAPAEEER
jgi:hypothetical protein